MRLILILLFVVTSLFTSAQTLTLQEGLSLGSLDWNLGEFPNTSLFDQNKIERNTRLGLIIKVGSQHMVNFGVGYITKSGKSDFVLTDVTGTPTGETLETSARFHYITLNALYTKFLTKGATLVPFVELGPKVDFYVGNNFNPMQQFDSNVLNDIQMGIIGGIGVEKRFNRWGVGIVSRYHYDITNIASWQNEGQESTNTISGNRFNVNLSLSYNLGR